MTAPPLLRPAEVAVPTAARAMLATASAEIRAPVHTVLGMSELLAQTTLTPSQRQYVDALRRSASSLAVLLDDILDLSKLQQRGPAQRQERFWLPDLITRVAEVAAVQVQVDDDDDGDDGDDDGDTDDANDDANDGANDDPNDGANDGDNAPPALTVSMSPRTPRSLVGDPVRLQQVLVNLVVNAVKYAATAPVSLTIDGQTDGPDAHLVFSVRDGGRGIPAERLETIFEAWQRLPEHSHIPGSGLGLTVARRLVDAMGGVIEVESRTARTPASEPGAPGLALDVAGTGSLFRVRVTLSMARPSTQATTMSVAVRSLRFLVIGDAGLAESVRAALAAWAPKIEHCGDEGEGERLFHLALGRGEPFHVVVLDAALPYAGAVAFGSILRGQATVLVVLPIRSLADVGNLVEEIGATPVLLPMTTASLYAALERSLDPVAGRPALLPDELPDLGGRVVHVADDDDDACTLLRSFLDGTGVEVHAHRTTTALLQAVLARPQRVGLVVCDVDLEPASDPPPGAGARRKRTGAESAVVTTKTMTKATPATRTQTQTTAPLRGAAAVLESLLRNPDGRDVPVVAVTARNDDATLADLGARGFAAVMQKPFTRTTLLALVRRLVRAPDAAAVAPMLTPLQLQLEARMALARRDHRALEQLARKLPEPARRKLETAARRKDDAAVRAVLRALDARVSAVAGDADDVIGDDVIGDDVKARLPDYLQRRSQDARDIADAVASGRFDQVAFIGRKLGGSAAAFGLPRLGEVGRRLELAGTRRDAVEVKLLLRRLQDLLASASSSAAASSSSTSGAG